MQLSFINYLIISSMQSSSSYDIILIIPIAANQMPPHGQTKASFLRLNTGDFSWCVFCRTRGAVFKFLREMFSIHGMRIHNCHAAGDVRSRNQRIVPEIEEVQQKVVA